MTIEKMVEHVNGVLRDTYHSMGQDDIGCIVYVFDRREGGGGTGFNSDNCDVGDALVAIKRIAEKFGIDLKRLSEVIP